jgi:hypothetical protein
MAPKNRESLFGYQRIAKEVIASIEDRLDEMMSRQSPEARPRMYRRPLGSWAVRGGIGLLLAVGLMGGVLAWQGPRSEAVARWAPQSVIDLLSSRQDPASEQSAESGMRETSSFRTMAENDGPNGVAGSIDQSQLVQKMAQDIANLQQGIEQLRAGQDQMMRMLARTSGLNAQARTAVPPRPLVGQQQQTTGLALNPPPPRRTTTSVFPPPLR